MSSWDSYSFLFGPVVVLGFVGVLVLILRWAFSPRSQSLVQRPPRQGSQDDYGLLVAVASPSTFVEGEMVRLSLQDKGIRASLIGTNDGPRVMVFPQDEQRARELLT